MSVVFALRAVPTPLQDRLTELPDLPMTAFADEDDLPAVVTVICVLNDTVAIAARRSSHLSIRNVADVCTSGLADPRCNGGDEAWSRCDRGARDECACAQQQTCRRYCLDDRQHNIGR